MADLIVRLDGVSKTWGVTTVLSDVTCRIRRGQRVALVGPSGSGKSTLLHLMAGLTDPTAGTVSWPALGPRERLRPAHAQVAFQGQSLFPALDVAANVALPLVLAGRAKSAGDVARAMLGRFGLEGIAANLPEELSGGQAQRVALARALAVGPDLLLADEPTGQLDSATAVDVTQTLLDIAEMRGMALIVATHDPRVAECIGETWTVEHGRLTPASPLHHRQPA